MASESPTVNVDVALPPTSSPTTDQNNAGPAVVVLPTTATTGEAAMADLLSRVRALETEQQALKQQVEAAQAMAIVATVSDSTPATDREPETPEEPETLEVPDSSDDGPEAPAKPPPKKAAWHHWI